MTIAIWKHRITRDGFEELLMNLRDHIETLGEEKSGLLTEIQNPKEKGETKAHPLENGSVALRKEAKTFEELLKIKRKEVRARSC